MDDIGILQTEFDRENEIYVTKIGKFIQFNLYLVINSNNIKTGDIVLQVNPEYLPKQYIEAGNKDHCIGFPYTVIGTAGTTLDFGLLEFSEPDSLVIRSFIADANVSTGDFLAATISYQIEE